VPSGRLAVDGGELVEPQGVLLQTRRRLMHNGAALVTLVLDPRGMLLAPPKVALRGVAAGETDGLAEDAEAAITALLDRLPGRVLRDDEALADAVRQAVRRAVRAVVERRPVIEVHTIRLPPGEGAAARAGTETVA
jgi:ribonuclease J